MIGIARSWLGSRGRIGVEGERWSEAWNGAARETCRTAEIDASAGGALPRGVPSRAGSGLWTRVVQSALELEEVVERQAIRPIQQAQIAKTGHGHDRNQSQRERAFDVVQSVGVLDGSSPCH